MRNTQNFNVFKSLEVQDDKHNSIIAVQGMVKTYQLSKLGEFGSSLKVAPVTTEKVRNLNSCLQVNGSSEVRVEPQSILPDLTGFKV
jgi:hypothetical protein